MLRTSVQTVINIVVIVLVVGALVLGAIALIPPTNPVGPVLGRMLTTKNILDGMLENLDAIALAEALRNNPDMMKDLFVALGDEGAETIAVAVNENPEFVAVFVANMDPETIAYALNDPASAAFTTELMGYLDPEAIAAIVNESGPFATDLLGYLDPKVIADALNANGDFLTASTAAMDPAVMAGAVNENGDFVAALIGFLDPAVLAAAANANPGVVGDLLGYLDTAVVAGVVNANGGFVSTLMRYLDPQVLTAGMNTHPTFLSRTMAYLNPAVIAGVLNANSGDTADMISYLSDDLLNNVLALTAHDPGWINGLMARLDPAVIAAMMDNSSSFTSGLINALDPAWAAGIANANPDLVFKVMDAIDPELVATMLNNESMVTRVLPLIDTAAIGAALAEHTDFVTRLLPLLDPALAEYTNKALEGNPELAKAFLANLDGAQIASALAQAPAFITGLVKGLKPGFVAAALKGSNANPQFMIKLTNALDASAVSQALDLSGSFMPALLAALPNSVAAKAGKALSANTGMVNAVLGTADPKMLASILNSGAADALIAGLIPLLDEGAAQAIAQGVNLDAAQPAGQSMIRSLIIASDAGVVADAMNNNPDFVAGLMANLSDSTAAAIAEGLNESVVDEFNNYKPGNQVEITSRYLNGNTGKRIAEALDLNPGIIKPLLANLDKEVGQAIAEGLNQNTTDLSTQLMGGLDAAVGVELAKGLEDAVHDEQGNYIPSNIIVDMLSRLDVNVGMEVALGLNNNGEGFLEAMIANTSPKLNEAIVNVMNDNYGPPKYGTPYNMDNFLGALIRNLDENTAAAVAAGLNGNAELVEHLVKYLDGAGIAQELANTEAWTVALIKNLDANALATALNDALATSGGKAFVSDLLSTLDGTMIADALNNNPGLTEVLMDEAGAIGLGNTLHDLLARAQVGEPGAFLTNLIGGLDGAMMTRVLNKAWSGETLTSQEMSELPYPGHTFLQCTWFLVYLKATTFIGPMQGWAWSQIEGADPGDPSLYQWSGPAVVPPDPDRPLTGPGSP